MAGAEGSDSEIEDLAADVRVEMVSTQATVGRQSPARPAAGHPDAPAGTLDATIPRPYQRAAPLVSRR